MPKGPAVGYIYGIKDPDSGQIIFVGNGLRPWESIQRHLNRSSNPSLRNWATELLQRYPNGLQILREVVCEQWHNPEEITLPEVPEGVTRLEWVILGEETETFEPRPGENPIYTPPIKAQIIKKLKDEGIELLNETPGRRRKRARLKVASDEIGDVVTSDPAPTSA